MELAFRPFKPGALKQQPGTLKLSGQHLQYMAFEQLASECSGDAPSERCPLLVVCGAFESYNLHRNLVARMIAHQRVILLSLPGLGTNPTEANPLTFSALAGWVNQFLETCLLEQVCLIGSSAAASVVNSVCCAYPHRVHKAIVHGIAHRPRKSWQMLLSESLIWLDEPDWEQNAQASLLYLINEEYLEETRFHSLYKRYFTKRFANFDPQQKEQFRNLVQLLLNDDGVQGYPDTDILVCTGEYDHFTLPFEHAEYADQCANSRFALVENADHLLHFERQAETLDLFECYLLGQPIDALAGVKVYPPQTFCGFERRSEVRYEPVAKKAQLHTDFFQVPVSDDPEAQPPTHAPVVVRNLNFSGCLLELDRNQYCVKAHARDLVVELSQPPMRLAILAFEQCEHTMRCVFKHQDYPQALSLKAALEDTDCFRLPRKPKPVNPDADLDMDPYDDLRVGS